MLAAAGVNWTTVLVTGVPAIIGAVCAGAALIIAALNRRSLSTGNGQRIGSMVRETRERTEDLKTPSGAPIGTVVELTHDHSSVVAAAVPHLLARSKKVEDASNG